MGTRSEIQYKKKYDKHENEKKLWGKINWKQHHIEVKSR